MTTYRIGIGSIPLVFLCFFVATYSAAADAPAPSFSASEREEIVVLGSFSPRTRGSSGGAVTRLSALDLADRGSTAVADVLREVPGIAVNRSGPVGAVTQVRIRGAEGNHTLVLIDGIEANDPAGAAEFDFANMSGWGLEALEVLRGPQSSLYGSEAIGGVVHLATPDPAPGLEASGQASAGSFGTAHYAARIEGGTEQLRGFVSASRFTTDGVSASAIESEDDGYENTSLSGKVVAELSDVVTARVVLRHHDNASDTDSQDFAFPETPTQGLVVDSFGHVETTQFYGLAEIEASLLDGRWLHRASYGVTRSESEFFDDHDLTNASRGERRKLHYDTSYRFGNAAVRHILTLALQQEELEYDSRFLGFAGADQEQQDDQLSIIGEYGFMLGRVGALDFSVRRDENDRFRNTTTYRASGSYLFEALGARVHGSLGTGITNPTFLELFGFFPDSFIGNPDLKPERSTSWDIGVELAILGGRGLLDITYFDAELTDEIVTLFLPTFESTVDNERGESERSGVELSGSLQLDDTWMLRGSYTYLDATDPDGDTEVRRPRHSGSVTATGSFLDGRLRASLSALRNGEQEDLEFVSATPATRVDLDGYTLLGVLIAYRVTDSVEVFVQGENLLDEDYTEVFGYRSPGASAQVGVRASL